MVKQPGPEFDVDPVGRMREQVRPEDSQHGLEDGDGHQANEQDIQISDADLAAFKLLPRPLKVLAIGEDWCRDTIDNLPIVAKLAHESVARHGGRFLIRGGAQEVIEGERSPRMVMVEFESLEAVRAWYDSEDYQACLPMRLESSKGRMIAVEGYAG